MPIMLLWVYGLNWVTCIWGGGEGVVTMFIKHYVSPILWNSFKMNTDMSFFQFATNSPRANTKTAPHHISILKLALSKSVYVIRSLHQYKVKESVSILRVTVFYKRYIYICCALFISKFDDFDRAPHMAFSIRTHTKCEYSIFRIMVDFNSKIT